MTTRTTQTVVRFSSAFLLPGFDAPQPAGEYRVDQDEESIDGLSRLAWRRVAAFIHLPAIALQVPTQQIAITDANGLKLYAGLSTTKPPLKEGHNNERPQQ